MQNRMYCPSPYAVGAIFISMLFCPSLRAQKTAPTNALAVKVLVDEELSSQTAKAGQEVRMHISEGVMKGGKEVIPPGAQVRAHVTRVKQPGHGDRDGQIKLTMVSAQAVTGSWVPLHKGAVRRGSRLIALFAGPCSVPFPLTMLMVGEDVKIHKGQALTAYVRSSDLP
jgi:hypothetical protein